jgi:hypothetical protein
MIVGDVVLLKQAMLGEEQHSVGVVFHVYDDGVQIMFTDGGYDGFSTSEQSDFLIEIGHDKQTENYQFKNVMQVSRDYGFRLWDHVFQNKKYRRDRGF